MRTAALDSKESGGGCSVKTRLHLTWAILLVVVATPACGAAQKSPNVGSRNALAAQTKMAPTFPSADVRGCVSKSIGYQAQPVIVYSGMIFWKVIWNVNTGCVAIAESKGVGYWTSYSVTKNALNGGRISTVSVEMLSDATHGWILVSAAPNAGAEQDPRAFFRTVDGGKTWSRVPVEPSAFPVNSAQVNWSFTSPENGWMVTVDPSYSPTRLFIYRSIDGGVSWAERWVALPRGLHAFLVLPPTMTSGGLAGTLALRALSHNDKQYVVLTYATADGGLTWRRKSEGIYGRVGIAPNRTVPTGVKPTPTRSAPAVSLPLLVGSKPIPWRKEFQRQYTVSSCTRVGYRAFEVPVPLTQAVEMLKEAFIAPNYTEQSSVSYGPNRSVEQDITYTSNSSNVVVILSFKGARADTSVGYWVSDILPAASGYTCRSIKL